MSVRGHDRGRGHGARNRYCHHCGRSNHTSANCWATFGMPERAKTASTAHDMVLVPCTEYAALLQSARNVSPTVASAPTTACVVSSGKFWMLDSGASTHITGNKSIYTSFSPSCPPPVRLADDTFSPVTGTGVVQPTTAITLHNVLFASKFPISLLSVSQLTKTHNCFVTFYPSYFTLQDLQTKRTIGWGYERDGLYYLNDGTPAPSRAFSATVSPYQWHCRLGHPSSGCIGSTMGK